MTASTTGTGTFFGAKGFDISLAALQRQDPYINKIVDVASQVALYTFNNRTSEWEKTDVEGTLFVYTRLASPRHGFTIMNRLSMQNQTEPITKDLDFQLQDPFLLYRNARLSIYGIWFYDKEDCQRIAELMKNLTMLEQVEEHSGWVLTGALDPGGGKDSRGVDILQMLTKARSEYDKGKPTSEPKEIGGGSGIYDNPNLIKPIPVKPLERQSCPQERSPQVGDIEHRIVSLAALFGAQSKPEPTSSLSGSGVIMAGGGRPAVARSLSYEDPPQGAGPRLPSASPSQHCPAIQKLIGPQRVPSELLQPVSESPESHLCENGACPDPVQRLFQNPPPHSMPPLQQPPLLAGLQPAQPLPFAGPILPQARPLFFSPARMSLPSQFGQVTGVVSPHELLQRLQLIQQEQGMTPEHTRPHLAPHFHEPAPHLLQPAGALARPLEVWVEGSSSDPAASTTSPHPSGPAQVTSPQRIPATVAPTLLLSPSVFSQAKSAKSLVDCIPPPVPLLVPPVAEERRLLTRRQLQSTLLHLIQNDPSFLDSIYEAYTSVVSKDRGSKQF